jgi:hypothetical protein
VKFQQDRRILTGVIKTSSNRHSSVGAIYANHLHMITPALGLCDIVLSTGKLRRYSAADNGCVRYNSYWAGSYIGAITLDE